MYDTSTINTSATIVAPTGAAIQDGSFLAVKFNDAGAFVLAAAGDVPVGIIPGGVQDTLGAGEDLTVQIKDIGLCKAGGVIKAGALVACGANGVCVTAAAGANVLGQALTPATKAGDVIQVQLFKGGCAKASA